MSRLGDTALLREMFLAGQSRWPSLALGFEQFAAHLQAVLSDGEGLPLEPWDLYLCCACVTAQPAALRSFERENASVAEAAIRSVYADDDFVRDSLQELWHKLLLGAEPKVRLFSGRGPLKAWVRIAAKRVALDRRRADAHQHGRTVALPESLAAADVSAEVALLKARFGPAFQDALRDAVMRLSEQERNVLRLHVVGRFSIDKIGTAYKVHRATVARWIERARERIHDEVRRALCQDHKLTPSEFHSLAVLLGSEIELSLGPGSAAGASEPEGGRT